MKQVKRCAVEECCEKKCEPGDCDDSESTLHQRLALLSSRLDMIHAHATEALRALESCDGELENGNEPCCLLDVLCDCEYRAQKIADAVVRIRNVIGKR